MHITVEYTVNYFIDYLFYLFILFIIDFFKYTFSIPNDCFLEPRFYIQIFHSQVLVSHAVLRCVCYQAESIDQVALSSFFMSSVLVKQASKFLTQKN